MLIVETRIFCLAKVDADVDCIWTFFLQCWDLNILFGVLKNILHRVVGKIYKCVSMYFALIISANHGSRISFRNSQIFIVVLQLLRCCPFTRLVEH